jgi:DNA helicase-2/ATP-dependent DNA helicase PcrA
MKTMSIQETIKNELNEAQQQAAFFGEGPLLIIAGAGSGKTKTLVYRVANLVDKGIPAEQILLLTFTRKAAEEMLKRAALILDHRCENISGGTFHGFANTALRHYAHTIGFEPNFTILDRGDSEDLIQTIRKDKGLSSTDKRFPKKSTLASLFSKSTNTSTAIKTIVASDYPQFLDFTEEIQLIETEYHRQKKLMQVMDYDDLLTRFLECLTLNPEVQKTFKSYYKYILVDEYQDTNTIQANLVKSILNDTHQNITVVGDDAQSIYSFRGAHFENIIKFPDHFPNATVVKLEQNYRSTQPILDLTNAMISNAAQHFSKKLFSENESSIKPKIIETTSDNEQSKFICKKILELREQDIALSKIAVLIRSGWHSNDLELELKAHNIPFQKMGGFKFVETSHIKDVLSYCQIIYNPLDLISWTRLLLLLDGCGAAAAKKITSAIPANINNLESIIANHQSKKYAGDLLTLLKLVGNPSTKTLKPSLILDKALNLYNPLFKLKYDDFHKRQSDIDSLATIIDRFKTLETMLTELSLDPPNTTQSGAEKADSDEEKLCLSTIHSSKGLEWDTVFILSAIDGYIPSFQSLGDTDQIEEERRLLYVALTRAERELFIMKPNLDLSSSNHYKFSGMQFSNITRFIDQNMIEIFTDHETCKPPKRKSNFSIPMDDDDPDATALYGNPYKSKKFYF